MVKRIVWTKTAGKKFDEIAAYLYDNESLQVAHNFAKNVYGKIDLLAE